MVDINFRRLGQLHLNSGGMCPDRLRKDLEYWQISEFLLGQIYNSMNKKECSLHVTCSLFTNLILTISAFAFFFFLSQRSKIWLLIWAVATSLTSNDDHVMYRTIYLNIFTFKFYVAFSFETNWKKTFTLQMTSDNLISILSCNARKICILDPCCTIRYYPGITKVQQVSSAPSYKPLVFQQNNHYHTKKMFYT